MIPPGREHWDAGARQIVPGPLKAIGCVALVVLPIVLFIALFWFVFFRHIGATDRIVARSNGEITYVQIVDVGRTGVVQVILAPGVSETEARRLTCSVVLPALREDGVTPNLIQVVGRQLTLTLEDDFGCGP